MKRKKGNNANNDCATRQRQAGIRNRALALVVLQEGATETGVYAYHEEEAQCNADKEDDGSDDEEDAFLTVDGVQFVRDHCLHSNETFDKTLN
jgi:hypothetical protein